VHGGNPLITGVHDRVVRIRCGRQISGRTADGRQEIDEMCGELVYVRDGGERQK